MNTLEFEPSAFRNWTVAYCQLAYHMWVTEFRRQFGWSLTDMCYEWNGSYTTMYRAPSEHIEKLFHFVAEESQNDPDYFERIAHEAEQESADEATYFSSLQELDFTAVDSEKLKMLFQDFCAYVLPPMPKFFIVMYFPQALELHPEAQDKFKADNDRLIEARGKIDKIAAPIGNMLTEKFGHAALARYGLDISLARYLTLSEIESLFANTIDKEQLVDELSKRQRYCLIAGGEVVEMTIQDYLTSKGWRLVAESEPQQLQGSVAHSGSEKK
ncbi:MAG TPA: hypothetical protein VGE59_00550 [Patescibacteria group bacterium]